MTDKFSHQPDTVDLDVLYLGWQREAIEALQGFGGRVTCVVSSSDRFKPAEEGFEGAVAVARDHTCVEDILGALAGLASAPDRFRAVCSEDEFAIVTAAVLSHLVSEQAGSAHDALALRDKAFQKRLIRAAGIPTADYAHFADLDAVRMAVRSGEVATPFVIKPPAGAGSQHTRVIRDEEGEKGDVDALAAFGREAGATAGPWLIEKFISGEELHVDGAVRDGTVLVASASRYLHNVIEVHHGRLIASATLDEDAERELFDGVIRLTERALAALGHTDGVFHLEAFHDAGDLIFSECAGRIGGGMILEAVRGKYGVDLYHEWAAAVLGVPSPASLSVREPLKDSFGWANLTTPPGRIRSLPTRELIKARPGVVEGQLWAKADEVVGDMRQASHLLVAKALVRAPSEATARSQLRAVSAWFTDSARVDRLGDDHE
ncbi:acetyl-CoA carboxylase biotin carboxylase subunit family protein [Streptomyces sp. NBC_00859]|uniref:ATP-grasp domain-containing protein n=1 Tax=Streptomyces sp. NBC_00859 TaxID=2903682 RepID=UPI00386738E7|nr:ATP-grasp domain-containing protein [Streptomyces sp. NBC_00859]WSZ86791.1 ATP-grasp domain-containing protein [Streptomyces sp. NBC_00859]